MTTTLVETTTALGIVGFLGCELEWNVPEQTPEGLNITTSSPPKLHPSPPDSGLPGAPLPAEVPRRLRPQEGALSWGPSARALDTW